MLLSTMKRSPPLGSGTGRAVRALSPDYLPRRGSTLSLASVTTAVGSRVCRLAFLRLWPETPPLATPARSPRTRRIRDQHHRLRSGARLSSSEHRLQLVLASGEHELHLAVTRDPDVQRPS